MTQKDKVKELVGRGLDSYHTKSLQQMDRIEKKNKEQNHKISILSNELDNDYLTKTEEGSVISLEHSKEGMIYLDELQGNTLVNYCTDGSKELTLNGDIDVEGTFVTLTEGVDNGLIDVVCEGNTLVNLVQTSGSKLYGTSGSGSGFTQNIVDNFCSYTIKDNTHRYITLRTGSHKLVKPSTKYTIVFEIKENSIPNYRGYVVRMADDSFFGNYSDMLVESNEELNVGIHKICFTTFSDISSSTGLGIGFKSIIANDNNVGTTFTIGNVLLLEGDWTNRDIPPYFEGMKSVGQDDVNGHKIEILSHNKNLIDVTNGNVKYSYVIDKTTNSITDTSNNINYKDFQLYVYLKANKIYKLSYSNESTHNLNESNTQLLKGKCVGYNGNLLVGNLKSDKTLPTVESDGWYSIHCHSLNNNNSLINLQLEEGTQSTDYISYSLNKKEISLNEPLRGLPNGVKDRFVKIGGKLFIERNIGSYTFTGEDNWSIAPSYINENPRFGSRVFNDMLNLNNNNTLDNNICCDKIPLDAKRIGNFGIYQHNDSKTVHVFIEESRIGGTSSTHMKQWVNENNFTIFYQLETPIYEPLEVEPTLNTYNDITHIYNNSIIPCNMKIQNSGYNAIIKPSTLYTVALDTNKNGTIGMNLGGAKVTTTNNVATITTPATLTDDSLRLYGKGIKGSKVRLLEGDKTNWIPSHFEGMKSSFEDKFDDTDNTYKMEILMNNENLFDITKLQDDSTEHHIAKKNNANGFTLTRKNTGSGWNYSTWELPFKLKANTKYTISCKINKSNINSKPCCRLFDFTLQKDYAMLYSSGKYEFTTPINGYERIKLLLYSSIDNVTINEGDTVDFNDIKISEVKNGDFVNHQSNKIQFSSIEPLRKTRDAWDRFVFVDGKLMIERNCIEFVFDGSEDEGWSNSYQRFNKYYVMRCIPSVKIKSSWDYRSRIKSSHFPSIGAYIYAESDMDKYIKGISSDDNNIIMIGVPNYMFSNLNEGKEYLKNNPLRVVTERKEPIYEEIPHELQKIILEGYENGTLFIDTNIPPTSTVTYAGETPIVKATKLNKTEVLSNTEDINDNIIPYLMDMDYRVVCLQLQSENINDGVSMARLFGGAYEMLQRDIQSKRYSVDEYRHRLDAYLDANKIAEEEYNKLGDMLNE